MSLFTGAVSTLTEADLRQLISDRAVENIQLEFKREIPGKGRSPSNASLADCQSKRTGHVLGISLATAGCFHSRSTDG